jgi:NAD dependent epimerase/dehydratase family enzyme
LQQLLPLFGRGLGGPIGKGERQFSWISRRDLCRAIAFALKTPGLAGPANATAPHPVSNAGFTQALADALGQSAKVPVPPFALKLRFGSEMAKETLLSDVAAQPQALLSAGFQFLDPDIATALQRMCAAAG